MITNIDQLDFSRQYTYADYLTWKFEDRVELIKGWISRMSPAPLRFHQDISFKLSWQIGAFLKNKKCKIYMAPFDVRLTNKRKKATNKSIVSVVQPDLCVICDTSKLDEKGCIGAPDWVIEILSRGNTKKEMKDKFSLYEENGVKEYWIVFPDYFQVQAYDLLDNKFVLRNTYTKGDEIPVGIFEGFTIDSDDMFA
ncbi:Uma2 family endonuclease [Parasediminibacterium sp. JCM 36343]|uniref:Uma2 family endonuclease n=1 Tax=Parasediminibacterium sp. JCM 36343 TaxID=3374279 RepID=UPI00397D1D64